MLLGIGAGESLANGEATRPRGKAPAVAPPQAEAVPLSAQAGLVSLNFTGADLVEVIPLLAQYLKLNYTIDPGVRGTVTLYSAQPLRQEDLLPVFHQDTEKKRTGGTIWKMYPCSPNRRGGRTSPFPVVSGGYN